MILRSVVGKLWFTIIVLVSFVLLILSLFLNQKVEVTYSEDQESGLRHLAHEIQKNSNKMGHDCALYLSNVVRIAEVFNTYTVILDRNEKIISSNHNFYPEMKWYQLLTKNDLQKVFLGEQVVKSRSDMMLLASPYYLDGTIHGAIILYQLQDQPTESDIKKWIFYTALIGMALTTIFAFFLSTRITNPLIQMKKAAEKIAHGEFSARVPVRERQKDEIADLSITFNKMAEQLEDLIRQLSQEKEHLASILRSMHDGVVTLDKNGKVILTNPPADSFLSMWEPHFPAPLSDLFQKVIEDNQEHLGDISEKGRTWAVIMAPLYARDQVRGVVAVLREVTKERRLDKLRKDFVTNVSHELRTPISLLQGYSEALIDGIANTQEGQTEIARVINEESLRMGRLVNELLDLAYMEAGHIDLSLNSVDTPLFVQRIIRKFQTLAKSAQIELSSSISRHHTFVTMDEDKMEQVLTNLIENSIRHTPEGGKVTIHAYQDDRFQYFEVKDTGSGISEEDLPFLFERFYKADKARTRSQNGGTGLGLSIVKHLVHAHEGSVSVHSNNEGTVFKVEIPIQELEQKKQYL